MFGFGVDLCDNDIRLIGEVGGELFPNWCKSLTV